MPTPDWTVHCPVCGRAFDSMESLADSRAMVRYHMLVAHNSPAPQ